MKLRLCIGLSLLLFSFSSCKKDDDSTAGSSIPTVERKASASFTLNGQTTDFDIVNAQYTENPQYLDLTASSAGNAIQFECSPLRNPGTYTSSTTLGFAVSIGTNVWFCNNGCSVVVNENNTDLRWYDVTVSGQMTDLFSTSSATLNTARIKAFY